MANLYTGAHSFTGYKTLAELTGLTFTVNTEYQIQVRSNTSYFAREGTEGEGFEDYDHRPFTWEYDGEKDLYIGNKYAPSLVINVSD